MLEPPNLSPISRVSQRRACVAALALTLLMGSGLSLASDQSETASNPKKAQGKVEPFDRAALPAQGNRSKVGPAEWPAWRRAMEPMHWFNIPGTSLAKCEPPDSIPGNPRTRIGAWNGLAADVRTNRLYSAANGGHADYAGNEVCEIDLSVDWPEWKMLREPTAAEDILASNGSRKEFHDYYRDGRPASTHTYYALQFLPSRNAIFKFGAGSLWGTGNEANWKTDAFSLANNDWHPAGTWPDVVQTRRDVRARAVCTDPGSDEVYVAAPKELRRFDPQRGEYESLAPWPNSSRSVYKRPCAVDTDRRRVVFFGDAFGKGGVGLVYDIATKKLERIQFQGEDRGPMLKADQNFAWYDPLMRRFLVKVRAGGRVYAVDPDDFTVTRLETTGGDEIPNATNGVHTRWQRLPKLGGYAFYPSYRSGIWFLATE